MAEWAKSNEGRFRASRRRRPQFKLGSLLFFTTICAAIFAVAVVGINAQLLWLAAQPVTLLLCFALLTFRLPKGIKYTAAENALRLDGSHSPGRAQIEKSAQRKFRWNVLIALILVFASTNIVVLLVNSFVIPLPLGMEAVGEMEPSSHDWKRNLEVKGVESRFEKWYDSPKSMSKGDTESMKRLLWNSWPLAVGAAGIWLAGCFMFLKTVYFRGLRHLSRGIAARSAAYELYDIDRYCQETRSGSRARQRDDPVEIC